MQTKLAKLALPRANEQELRVVHFPWELTLNILTVVMLILPFVYTVASKSALPVMLIFVYPLTVFAALNWWNQNNSKAVNSLQKIFSVLIIFGIHQLIDFIAISDPILTTTRIMTPMSIAFIGLAYFSQKRSNLPEIMLQR